jgi:(S)-ureidoglycine aminohydrolase
MLVFERKHALGSSGPKFITGTTAAQPVLPVAGEVFALRKLLPQTADYDFNIHVMDFQPGEYLNVKVGSAAQRPAAGAWLRTAK